MLPLETGKLFSNIIYYLLKHLMMGSLVPHLSLI